MLEFRTKPLQDRLDIFNRIKKMHPERMAVLLYPTENCQLENLANEKYEIINPRMLVPQDFSVGMLLNNLRKELCLE